ncbi:MAG: hypothetical protein ABJM36_11130 [Algibacter sp.]|uniref:hypothetical protein n=1 Tax=Algibacter sp. TaxID=1872428 RepID=UPI00329959C1
MKSSFLMATLKFEMLLNSGLRVNALTVYATTKALITPVKLGQIMILTKKFNICILEYIAIKHLIEEIKSTTDIHRNIREHYN